MAATYNITVEQGVTFELQFTIKDALGAAINLAQYSFQASVVESTNDVTRGSFTFANTDLANGIITMSMAANVTSQIPESPTLVWDLIAQDPTAKVHRYLKGKCNILNPATSTDFD
jgi:hypothetical protein